MSVTLQEQMLEREAIANRPKHWVRAVTACNSHCLFCLDSDTPRNVYLPLEEVKAEILRGREELNAWKIILSGGEASLHPDYVEMIRYAREVGYGRIQTVTNGWRYADKEFFDACMDAGLQEITFSLHGHTKELHEELTAHPGSFERICKAILRAKRHSTRPIVSVDVCINKLNVGELDKIVELSIRLGVTEFDLLHVIPQASAYENREQMFYDPEAYLPILHKVFRLNRHPRYVIWTNRFPVSYLEGLEDLIQDPHKMLDEVNGRRFQVRRYLDEGRALDCREPERCVHCFIEPFCTTMDRVIERQNNAQFDVWWVGDLQAASLSTLPFGCRWLGVEVDGGVEWTEETLAQGVPLYLRSRVPFSLDHVPAESIVVADTVDHLSTWLLNENGCRSDLELLVELNQETAPWLLNHRDLLEKWGDKVRIHQPSHEHVKSAMERDVRDPAAFFEQLNLKVRVSGLAACLAPGTTLEPPLEVLRSELFESETGRLSIRELARTHVRDGYRAKSVRCRHCAVNDRCDGAHINWIRDQGLAGLRPLVEGAWTEEARAQLAARWPEPPKRLMNGRPPEPVAPSLTGHALPQSAVEDPLAVLARTETERLAKRRVEIRKRIAAQRKD